MINVTKTYLPPKEKYDKYVKEIFDRGWITNNGPLVQKLEQRLADHLGVKHIVLVANGTLALEVAYKALELSGEVITTPFSFVATTSSLVMSGLKPVFADIDPQTLNLDVSKIEKQINKNTSAIVPVHVFGNACQTEEIDELAKRHDLKVIYDAAHAFDVRYKDQSILNYGDISVLSFHATKLFHTIEGGALIINDKEVEEKVRCLINFGMVNHDTPLEPGTNAKMNEFEAAMGLCVLDDIQEIKHKRKVVYKRYENELNSLVQYQIKEADSTANYSYFPVIFKDEEQMLKIQKALNAKQIFPRRYFYPSLDTLPYIEPRQYAPISRDIARRILCLPIYPDLQEHEQNSIIEIIKGNV